MKEPLLYKFFRPILTFLFRLVYWPTYKGLEYIPKEGRAVLGGNHTCFLDCILLMSCTKRVIHFLAKDSLAKGPHGLIFKKMGIIPVNRSIHDKDALRNAKITLTEEKVIGIFPEGTINLTKDTVMPFKIGCVKMAHDTDSFVVPFVITGKYRIFRKSITLEFLEPYKITNDNLTEENNKLMSIISSKLEEKRK